ncbi:hypothetical protein [Victivallis sp. Marseille-Q1083]|uniref:hypothetical protein n=1 Tax=Victivallis sp. Marseille-Q1083 TaxID=2717288 RepID=UPI00158F17BF|nr:hypothetical protein [Victivallis sp. Marseille-Q1083]
MPDYPTFFDIPLESTMKAAYCKGMGFETHARSGSRTVNTADSRNLQSHCIVGLQGRRKPGTTSCVFRTLQALLISGVETGKGRKINGLTRRRSTMKDNCVPKPSASRTGKKSDINKPDAKVTGYVPRLTPGEREDAWAACLKYSEENNIREIAEKLQRKGGQNA